MKVLIIDDNPADTEIARDMLEAYGYETLEAPDAETGLDLAEKESPDLILMDMVLPDKSGVEAARMLKAKEETQDIPIAFYTAYSREEVLPTTVQAGCQGIISKPVEVENFIERVESILRL